MRKDPCKPTPGKWLHEAIMGALKGRGIKLEEWCRDNETGSQAIRAYTHGINSGPKSEKILNQLINDAGREVVMAMYSDRLFEQAEQFKKAA